MTCSNCGKDDCLGYDDCSRSALQAEVETLRAAQAQVTLAQRTLGNGGDDEQWRPGETAVAALCRHYEELQFIKAEYEKANASELTRDALAMQNAVLKAKIETLREALQQVIVDINDPHPRNGTLVGVTNSLRATQNMVAGVLEETE